MTDMTDMDNILNSAEFKEIIKLLNLKLNKTFVYEIGKKYNTYGSFWELKNKKKKSQTSKYLALVYYYNMFYEHLNIFLTKMLSRNMKLKL